MPERFFSSRAVSQVRHHLAWLIQHRLNLILTMLVLVAGTWAFIEMADNVLEGDTQAFDEAILRALRRLSESESPTGYSWLHQAARDLTALGSLSVLLIFTLAAAGFVLLIGDRLAFVLILAATWGGQAVCLALKAGLNRSRPAVVEHWDDVATASFPSGHSMMSAVVYLTLAVMLAQFLKGRRLKSYVIGIAAGLTFLVGLSRLILGVHYPTDVLAGWTAGLVWSLLCGFLASAYREHHRKTRLSLEADPG
jgi:undecaprenyl-diphosphatase